MKQTIYIDVLIAVNLFTNYFILLATAKFLQVKINKTRVISGTVIGAVCSLCILFPDTNMFISLIVKLFMSAGIVWVSFCSPKSSLYLKAMLCFYSISFGFSGTMLAIWFIIRPNGMLVRNGIVYFNISPIVLILSTVVSYFVIEMINKILGKREIEDSFYDLEVKIEDKKIFLRAKLDTGNSLKEPFSGLPVLVVREKLLEGVFQKEYLEIINVKEQNFGIGGITCGIKKRLRMVPFSSISGKGILPALKADYIMLLKSGIKKEAYVALCPDSLLEDGLEGLAGPDICS